MIYLTFTSHLHSAEIFNYNCLVLGQGAGDGVWKTNVAVEIEAIAASAAGCMDR